MAIYTSKFTQQEIDDGVDKANSAAQPEDLEGYLPLSGGTMAGGINGVTSMGFSATGHFKLDSYGNPSATANTDDNWWTVYTYNKKESIVVKAQSGNVGIGTTSPAQKLEVNGNVLASSFIKRGGTSSQFLKADGSVDSNSYALASSLSDYLTLSGGTMTGSISSNATYILNDANGNYIIEQVTSGSHPYYSIGWGSAANGGWEAIYAGKTITFSTGTTLTTRMTIASGGNVGIGTTSPSYKLHVAGAVGATAFTNTSDIRKKDIIENINIDVEDIANAPIFKFSWLDPEMPEGVNVGTSAQYWQTILPEIVSEANDDEKTLSMQYGVAGLASSIALARKAVEQENTIKAQEARIKALEDAIAEIQNKLK